MMELLAPAGSYEALRAAVQSGADAVYLGGTKFSARSSCANFDINELEKSINYCHERGTAVHVAANTLIKENECDDFLKYLGVLNDIGVDAVIIQDLGMANAASQLYPDLPLHASTQLTCASYESAKYLEGIGFSRIVLARELDINSIEKIAKGTKAKIEVFIHGAICMSYSGQCLMSSMIGGRSGNRGHCAQPCRLPYNFLNNGKTVQKGHLLSPKDMCLVNHLSELRMAGVDSLKIEGRLKRPEYVSAVVGVYRKCLDECREADGTEYNELLNAFNRSGFTDGYLTSKTGVGMMAYENPSNIAENKYSADTLLRCSDNAEIKKIPIKIECTVCVGMPVILTFTDNCKNSVTVSGEIDAEFAVNKPLSKDRVEAQLKKLGNTPYEAVSVELNLQDNSIVPIGELNNVRRMAVEALNVKRSSRVVRRKNSVQFNFEEKPIDEYVLSASCRNAEQAECCIKAGIKRIYSSGEVIKELKKKGITHNIIQELPPIDREGKNTTELACKSVLVSSFGQMNKGDGVKYSVGMRLNIANSYTLKLFSGCEACALSPELTIHELSSIKKSCDTEITVYGRLPLMTFENCPVKAMGKCDKGKSENALTDRMKEEFPLLCAEGCFCVLHNSKPLYMADRLEELKKCGAKFLKLDFTVETKEECQKIINAYMSVLNGKRAIGMKENTFTRGHFYKKTD